MKDQVLQKRGHVHHAARTRKFHHARSQVDGSHGNGTRDDYAVGRPRRYPDRALSRDNPGSGTGSYRHDSPARVDELVLSMYMFWDHMTVIEFECEGRHRRQ